jgi:chromosome segregation ATPase|tara:strand:+ start:481 stop:735 length:255 start_codon:yes stop_codon:yes gene_type:complete
MEFHERLAALLQQARNRLAHEQETVDQLTVILDETTTNLEAANRKIVEQEAKIEELEAAANDARSVAIERGEATEMAGDKPTVN